MWFLKKKKLFKYTTYLNSTRIFVLAFEMKIQCSLTKLIINSLRWRNRWWNLKRILHYELCTEQESLKYFFFTFVMHHAFSVIFHHLIPSIMILIYPNLTRYKKHIISRISCQLRHFVFNRQKNKYGYKSTINHFEI